MNSAEGTRGDVVRLPRADEQDSLERAHRAELELAVMGERLRHVESLASDDSGRRNAALNAELAQLKIHLHDISAERAAIADQGGVLQRELDAALARERELSEALDLATKTRDYLSTRSLDMHRAMKERDDALAAEAARHAETRAALDAAAEGLAAAERRTAAITADLTAAVERARSEAAEALAMAESARMQTETARARCDDERARAERFAARIEAAALEIAALRDECRDAYDLYDDAVDRIVALQRELDDAALAAREAAEREARDERDREAERARLALMQLRLAETRRALAQYADDAAATLAAESARVALLIDSVQGGWTWNIKRAIAPKPELPV